MASVHALSASDNKKSPTLRQQDRADKQDM